MKFKIGLPIIIIFILPALACSLAAGDVDSESDNRPVISVEHPTIILLAPKTGNRYALGAEIELYAEAEDPGSGVARIDFYDNFDNLIGSVTSPDPDGSERLTAIVRWSPPSEQTHFIKAQAFRADGTASNLQEVAIEVVLPGILTPFPTNPPASTGLPPTQPPTKTPENYQPPTPTDLPSIQAVVIGTDALNVRGGPGIDYGIVASSLKGGESYKLVGKSEDGLWYVVELDGGILGWVLGQYLQLDGDPEILPSVKPE